MVLPNKNIYKIGYKIKAFREANNLTQEQLADLINCNFKTIGNIENNRTMPDLKQVINLCDVLNVSMDELFADILAKTDTLNEPSEADESYPHLVSRKVSDVSSNYLQRLEKITLNLRKMTDKELNITEILIESLIKNR